MEIKNGETIAKEEEKANRSYSDAKFTNDLTIRHIPRKTYQEFLELRKIIGENSNWMTLKVLMENFKKGAIYDVLCEGMNSLDSRVAYLEAHVSAQSAKSTEEEESGVQTLGGNVRR